MSARAKDENDTDGVNLDRLPDYLDELQRKEKSHEHPD